MPKTKRCNVFPRVWAAIYGCTGMASETFRVPTGLLSRPREDAYACEVCAEVKRKTDAMMPPELQSFLREAQDAAGVTDYRTQKTRTEKGRPVLVFD